LLGKGEKNAIGPDVNCTGWEMDFPSKPRFSDRPQMLPWESKTKYWPSGRTPATALPGRIAPIGQQQMQIFAIDGNFPKRTFSIKPPAKAEADHAAIRRKRGIECHVRKRDQFALSGPIAIDEVEVVAIAIDDGLTIGRKFSDLSSGVSEFTRRATQHRHRPQWTVKCGLAHFVRGQ
jgi:hypothetical protein